MLQDHKVMSKASPVDIDSILDQMERPDLSGSRVCFDRQECELVVVSQDVMRAVANSDIEEIASLPEWKKDLVETAENILFYEKERYADVPEDLVHMTKHLMVEFIDSLPDGTLREELNVIAEHGNPIEIFNRILFDHPGEKDRWDEFSDARMREAVHEWIKREGYGRGL